MTKFASVNAEEGIIACILQNTQLVDQVTSISPDDFTDKTLRNLWSLIRSLRESNTTVDRITLSGAGTEAMGRLDAIAKIQVNVENLSVYAAMVQRQSVRRKAILASEQIKKLAEDDDFDDLLTKAEDLLVDMIPSINEDEPVHISEAMERQLSIVQENITAAASGKSNIIPIGISELRDLLGGWKPGKFYLVQGKPGSGKSSFIQDEVISAAAQSRAGVLIFSREMLAEEVAARQFAKTSGVTTFSQDNGAISGDEWTVLQDNVKESKKLKIWIDDRHGSIESIASVIARYKRQKGIKIVVIDYLQLLESSGSERMSESRALSEISRKIKNMANRYGIAIIVASSVNREYSKRDGGKSKLIMSDMRGSGNLEHDADVILAINPLVEESDDPDPACNQCGHLMSSHNENGCVDNIHEHCGCLRYRFIEVDIDVIKHRGGPTGTAHLIFDKPTTSFIPRQVDFGEQLC